jgi:hypothetical protein
MKEKLKNAGVILAMLLVLAIALAAESYKAAKEWAIFKILWRAANGSTVEKTFDELKNSADERNPRINDNINHSPPAALSPVLVFSKAREAFVAGGGEAGGEGVPRGNYSASQAAVAVDDMGG